MRGSADASIRLRCNPNMLRCATHKSSRLGSGVLARPAECGGSSSSSLSGAAPVVACAPTPTPPESLRRGAGALNARAGCRSSQSPAKPEVGDARGLHLKALGGCPRPRLCGGGVLLSYRDWGDPAVTPAVVCVRRGLTAGTLRARARGAPAGA